MGLEPSKLDSGPDNDTIDAYIDRDGGYVVNKHRQTATMTTVDIGLRQDNEDYNQNKDTQDEIGAQHNGMFYVFQETTLLQFQSLIVSSRSDQQLALLLERKLQLQPFFIEGALRRAIVSRKIDLLKHALEVNRLIPHDSSMKVNDEFLLQQIHRTVSLRELDLLRCLVSFLTNPVYPPSKSELQNIAILAIQVDFLDAVQLLVSKFPGCLEQTFQGRSILIALAYHKSQQAISMFSHLLKQGMNTNVQEPSGDTPLHVAVRENNTSIIELLLENNACIYMSNSQGQTPLDLASEQQCRHLFITRSPSPQPYEVSLYQAAKERKREQVQQLLNSGVLVNSKWINGHTALCAAAMNGDVDIVQLLLSHGSSTFPAGNTWPELPIVHALKANHINIAYLLMEKTEDDYELRTEKEREHIHRQLVFLLHYCACVNAVSVATLLLHSKYNLDLDYSFLMGLSPIHEACRSGQLDMVKLLLLYGVDPTIQSSYYLNTPLHYATYYGHTHIASHLLKYPQVNIDCENKQHETPLYCVLHGQLTAEEKGLTKEISVIFLITHGAKLLKPGRKNCELEQFDLNYAMQRWDFIPFQTQKLLMVVRNEMKPFSLMNAARFCIRGSLQVPVNEDVLDDLGLPYRLRNYVLLKDWFPTN